MLNPDEHGELFDAIESIVKNGGIEKVIAHPGLSVKPKDAKRLYKMRGHRILDHLEYGLGAFVR